MSGQVTFLDAPRVTSPATRPVPLHPVPKPQASAACTVAAEPRPVARRESRLFADFVTLTKPRIVVMVLVTAAVAAAVAAGTSLSLVTLLHTLFGTMLVAASAGAVNQVLERQLDRHMPRTAKRPLPAGRIGTPTAVAYTGALFILGEGHLAYHVGWLPAAFGAATWLLYAAIYTPLKTRTSFNTTVGAVAGGLPIFIGYTAAGGALTGLDGWLLFGVLVFWQYPHFMAIAWLYRRQYEEAGFRMTPVVEPSGRSAGWQSVLGAIAVAVCGMALVAGGLVGTILTVAVAVVSYGLISSSIRFKRQPEDTSARSLLRHSLLQLPGVMLIILIASFL